MVKTGTLSKEGYGWSRGGGEGFSPSPAKTSYATYLTYLNLTPATFFIKSNP